MTIALLFFSLFAAATAAEAQTEGILLPGGVDPSFTANLFAVSNNQGSRVSTTLAVRQPNGKTLLVGNFSYINGVGKRNFVRLNADGSVDTNFNPPIISGILTIVPLSNGKLLVGGNFSFTVGNINYRGLIRLNEDGSLDNGFFADTSDAQVIVVQPDGRILVGGSFSQVNGVSINRLARLNADGSLDVSFQTGTGFESTVFSLALQTDGKILAGGNFSNYNNTPRPRIARLNSDGSLDAGFSAGTGTNGSVLQIIVQPDNKILIAGDFTSVNGTTRVSRVARLETNGALDASFAPTVTVSNSFATEIVLQPDGKIIAAFNGNVTGSGATVLYRFNADGSTDNSFNAIIQSPVVTVLTEADGKIVIGGFFTQVNGIVRNGLARLNSDGSTDLSWNYLLAYPASASAIALQPDGKILVAGSFEYVNDKPKIGLARLNANGSVDESFNVVGNFAQNGFSGIVSIDPLAEGRILIAGSFTNIGGQAANRIARLKDDGSLDTGFNIGTGPSSTVTGIKVQPDGKIIVIGQFSTFNNTNRPGVVRLNTDGSVDTSFNPYPQFVSFGFSATALTLQSDGKILFAGTFTLTNGITKRGIIRLNANGALDESFDTFVDNGIIRSIVVQPDGKILIGGSFFGVNGVSRRNIARIHTNGSVDFSFSPRGGAGSTVNSVLLRADGKLWIGGEFTTVNGSRKLRLARLDADGSLDDFNLEGGITADNSFPTTPTVLALTEQADGRLLVGGWFSRVGGFERIGFARVNSPRRVLTPLFDFDGDGKTDFAVFRPASGAWFKINSSSGNSEGRLFGVTTDLIVPADYDGDLKTDFAVWRPATGQWFILQSATNELRVETFGANGDVPVAADYDGDGRDDLAVFRPTSGTWFLRRSRDGFAAFQFGANGDRPVIGDFDGDGKADIGVFRPSNGTWYLLQSQNGFSANAFGTNGDNPLTSDFDDDGKTDLAVFRPSNGTWYLLQSQRGFSAISFGASGDIPFAGDFDGDGKADIGVFRPSNGVWYLIPSLNGGLQTQSFGANGDLPVPAAYLRGN